MTEIERKLQVLAKIAQRLNTEKITWCVGASLLLYFKGIVDEFNDVDIMVSDSDTDKIEYILNQLGTLQTPNPNEKYKTKRFLEYIVDGVDVDVMSGFIIVNNNREYDCSLLTSQIRDSIIVDGQVIPLQSLGLWKRYYRLMGRESKVKLLADIVEE